MSLLLKTSSPLLWSEPSPALRGRSRLRGCLRDLRGLLGLRGLWGLQGRGCLEYPGRPALQVGLRGQRGLLRRGLLWHPRDLWGLWGLWGLLGRWDLLVLEGRSVLGHLSL